MNKKGIASIALAGAALALTGCGGGGGSTSTALETRVSTTSTTVVDSGGISVPTQSGDSGHETPQNPGNAGGGVQQPGGNDNQPPADTPGSGSGGCTDAIARCFDTAAAQIARYKDNKQAAASYTFDDGYQTSFAIAPMFEQLGWRASFYLIAGKVPDEDWAKWKTLAANGHEIGTHSMTHTIDLGDPAVTDAQLDTEINQAQRLIGQKLGIMPRTLAFPWHSYNDRSRSMALQNHIAIRDPGPGDTDYSMAYFDQDHYPDLAKTLAAVNAQLSDTVANGGWYVAAGHGLDGDGWSPVTTQFLQDHLAFARGFSSTLWIDTYLNVARYRLCRKLLTASAAIDSAQQMTVRLNGNYDPAVCNAPMTVAIPVIEAPAGAMSAATSSGAAVALKLGGGMLLLEMVPGDEVRVRTGD